MKLAWKCIRRAVARWWQGLFTFVLLNILWLILQIPIVTGPAATAAMYAAARRSLQGDSISVRLAAADSRRLFVPALKWGAINLLIGVALAVNFAVYGQVEGTLWSILRAVWAGIGLVWFALNLFYWPFWLAQEQPSIRNSVFNGVLLMAKQPVFSISLIVFCAALIAVSVLLTLPLTSALMAWLALMGVAAVDEELKRERTGSVDALGTQANSSK